MGIPHHIILSNIIGRWGGMLHVKHERLFAISWGLFHFHTSLKFTHTLLKIDHLFFPTTDKSHNHAIYKGWGVFTSTIENTLYNHLPSSTNRIVSYIYTNSNLLTYHHQLPLTKSPYLPINTTLLP